MAKNVLTHNLSEPLNGVTSAKVDINAGDGNMIIDGLTGGGQVLATGALQYMENRSVPDRSVDICDGRATLTLRGGEATRQRWFRLPWAACNGATEWQVHLNPAVAVDITAHSDGGNVKLDLAGMAVTRVSADTGGGNMEVVLPDNVADLSVAARSGAGNVAVRIPAGIAARIQATTGLGKVIVEPRFGKTGKDTYQSVDYDGAAKRVEITLKSGAGNVSVSST
ncbi:MAG: DUF4097 family beta strand repeat-containing protein [Chloroflexota bacterium]